MGIKLHRKRRVFRDRRPARRIILSIVAAIAVIALGFFGAKYFTEHPIQIDSDKTPAQSTASSLPDDTASAPENTPSVNTTPTPANGKTRGFFLPTKALHNTAALKTTLKEAADAAFTHVVFDLKDSDGTLYFRSESSRAVQANAFSDDALSLADIKAVFSIIREAGLSPLPRLYAFMDNKGARALPNARVMHQSDPGWVWYDANPSKGGRAWLNPYSDEAQLYIIELAKELHEAGAAGILLDGVQFPRQTSSASFGDTTLERSAVLTAFVHKARTLLGNHCPVLLCCTADSALGADTLVYGGNPLTFTPAAAAPMLLTGNMPTHITVGNETLDNSAENLQTTIQALVNQLSVRIKVIAEDKQPVLTPWLQAYDYTAAQIKTAMQGCIDGGADSFILYNPTGKYDFDALK